MLFTAMAGSLEYKINFYCAGWVCDVYLCSLFLPNTNACTVLSQLHLEGHHSALFCTTGPPLFHIGKLLRQLNLTCVGIKYLKMRQGFFRWLGGWVAILVTRFSQLPRYVLGTRAPSTPHRREQYLFHNYDTFSHSTPLTRFPLQSQNRSPIDSKRQPTARQSCIVFVSQRGVLTKQERKKKS